MFWIIFFCLCVKDSIFVSGWTTGIDKEWLKNWRDGKSPLNHVYRLSFPPIFFLLCEFLHSSLLPHDNSRKSQISSSLPGFSFLLPTLCCLPPAFSRSLLSSFLAPPGFIQFLLLQSLFEPWGHRSASNRREEEKCAGIKKGWSGRDGGAGSYDKR